MKSLIIAITLFSLKSYSTEYRIGLLGLTMHGEAPQLEFVGSMPRKLDNKAIFVWHPEINFTRVDDNGIILNLTYLRDCTDHNAYYAGLGKQYIVDRDLRAGFVVGLYNRQEVIYSRKKDTVWYEESTIPMPQVYLEKIYKINQYSSISFQLSSSLLLSHATVGITFGGSK